MTIDVFDGLQFARRLKDMGVSDSQAEAGAELARETLARMANRLATREDLHSIRNALELKLERMETKFDTKLEHMETKFATKLEHMEAKFDARFTHIETKFDAKLDGLGALLRAEIRVTRVMVGFLGLIVLGTWGVLALPLLTSVRLA